VNGSEAAGRGRAGALLATWATPAAVILVAVLGILALQTGIAGLFHDDGIYLSVAKSIAEGHGYRLENLPGTPFETKYPFLYPGLLALLWRAAPPFPESIPILKSVGVASLVAIALLAARWFRRRGGSTGGQAAFVLLACVNPLVLPSVDYTMTELPFLALCLASLCLADAPAGPSATGWTPGRREAVTLGLVVGAAMLLRQAAAPLVLGGAIVLWRRGGPGAAMRFAVIVVACVVPWLIFKWAAAPATANPLIRYYVEYEPSVPELLLRNGASALGIVRDNLRYVAEGLDKVLFLPAAPSLRLLVYPVVFLGWARGLSRPAGLIHWFAGLYLLLVVLWPWQPARYLLPLAPLMPFGLVVGTRELWRLADRLFAATPARMAGRAFVSLPAAAIVVLSLGWSVAFVEAGRGDEVRLWWAEDSGYAWSGFEETFDWLRANTGPDELLASGLDPVYYLYTGRRAVRPWFHQPWTYFYPAGRATPDLGAPDAVREALEQLDVRWLVTDPLVGFTEGSVNDLFERLLLSYSTEYGADPVLRFVSSDSLHRVYELPSSASR